MWHTKLRDSTTVKVLLKAYFSKSLFDVKRWKFNGMFILTKVLDEFLNDMKQEHRIDELKHELMKAIVGYVFPRLSVSF